MAMGNRVATKSSAEPKAFLAGANGGWAMLRPRMRIESLGAAKLRAGTQSPLATWLGLVAEGLMPEVSIRLFAAAASPDAEGTIPASRRSVSLPGSARRR
ncbi:hypothetical protein D3C81_1830390 [compost metagenome]